MSIPVDGTGAHGRSPMISWPGVDACTACVLCVGYWVLALPGALKYLTPDLSGSNKQRRHAMCRPLNNVEGEACMSRLVLRTRASWQCHIGGPRLQSSLTEPSSCSQVHRECREQPHGNKGGNMWGRGLNSFLAPPHRWNIGRS